MIRPGDDVRRLEVIENGRILRSFPREGNSAEISFQFQYEVREAAWLAVRASGSKLGEVPLFPLFLFPDSVAHSGPIYVTAKGTPPLSAHPRAKALARAWLARLEDLETRLGEDQLESLAEWPSPYQDGVDEDAIRKNRPALLKAIQSAREHYKRLER